MNCQKIQQELMLSERPDQPSGDLLTHLAGCAACRSWQRRLVDAERQFPLLPVPASSRRDQFLQQIRQGQILAEPTVPAGASLQPTEANGVHVPPGSTGLPAKTQSASELWLGNPHPAKERGLQKLAVSLALAASLALFALGWWAWPHRSSTQPQPPDPIVARQQDRDQRLAQARTPRERVQVLAELAQGLHREARQLAGKSDPEELRVVARFYREVVRENLLDQARQLPRNDRPMLVKVANHLGEVESELGGLLTGEVEPAAAGPLREIALAARESHDQLRELLRTSVS